MSWGILLLLLIRWSSLGQWAERRQLSFPGFHWSFWEPNPRSCRTVLQARTGTALTVTQMAPWVLLFWVLFSLALCPISPIRMGLCRMDIDGIHQSRVSLPHMLCASSPNSPTTMLWRTVYHGGHLYYINSVGLNQGSTQFYKSHHVDTFHSCQPGGTETWLDVGLTGLGWWPLL